MVGVTSLIALWATFAEAQTENATASENKFGWDPPPVSLWEDGKVGDGFRKGAHELSASAAVGLGMPIFGSQQHHNWVLGFFEYGWVFSDVVAKGEFCQGNWELIGDLFGGFQYHPDHAFVVAVAPLVRYNFATGTRWVPFVNAGAGLSLTDIRDGDLSTRFEFNLQFGGGARYFLKENLSFDVQCRFIHLSNAGMQVPNLGLNNATLMLGASWFY